MKCLLSGEVRLLSPTILYEMYPQWGSQTVVTYHTVWNVSSVWKSDCCHLPYCMKCLLSEEVRLLSPTILYEMSPQFGSQTVVIYHTVWNVSSVRKSDCCHLPYCMKCLLSLEVRLLSSTLLYEMSPQWGSQTNVTYHTVWNVSSVRKSDCCHLPYCMKCLLSLEVRLLSSTILYEMSPQWGSQTVVTYHTVWNVSSVWKSDCCHLPYCMKCLLSEEVRLLSPTILYEMSPQWGSQTVITYHTVWNVSSVRKSDCCHLPHCMKCILSEEVRLLSPTKMAPQFGSQTVVIYHIVWNVSSVRKSDCCHLPYCMKCLLSEEVRLLSPTILYEMSPQFGSQTVVIYHTVWNVTSVRKSDCCHLPYCMKCLTSVRKSDCCHLPYCMKCLLSEEVRLLSSTILYEMSPQWGSQAVFTYHTVWNVSSVRKSDCCHLPYCMKCLLSEEVRLLSPTILYEMSPQWGSQTVVTYHTVWNVSSVRKSDCCHLPYCMKCLLSEEVRLLSSTILYEMSPQWGSQTVVIYHTVWNVSSMRKSNCCHLPYCMKCLLSEEVRLLSPTILFKMAPQFGSQTVVIYHTVWNVSSVRKSDCCHLPYCMKCLLSLEVRLLSSTILYEMSSQWGSQTVVTYHTVWNVSSVGKSDCCHLPYCMKCLLSEEVRLLSSTILYEMSP